MALTLREYQQTACEYALSYIDAGGARLCIVAPCGAGKTVLAAGIIQGLRRQGARVLFLAHRQELILQTSRKLDAALLPHGILMGDHPRHAPRLPVQVASIQTLVRRLDGYVSGALPSFDIIFIDETHRARADSYGRVVDAFPTAPVLGLTATPERNDGRGLGELFHDLYEVTTTRALIDAGWLVPYRAFVFDSDELDALDAVRQVDGDYDAKGASAVMGRRAVVGRIVEEWGNRSAGRRSVYFATTVERSRELVREFNALRRHGGPVCYAEHLDASTPDDERQAIIGPGGRLERGETTLVSNVNLFTEGVDCPAIETVGLCAPTMAWSRFVQMVGRGLRPSPETGKTDLLVLDHARCILTHGRPDDPRELNLSPDRVRRARPRKQDFREMHACDGCGCVYPPARKACPDCATPNPDYAPPPLRHVDTTHVHEIHRTESGEEAKRERLRTLLDEERRSRRRSGFAASWFRREFGHEPPEEWMQHSA